ncbi:hypothetical protein U1Q18_009677, partial [Sarracenia purpurea var. burkii]
IDKNGFNRVLKCSLAAQDGRMRMIWRSGQWSCVVGEEDDEGQCVRRTDSEAEHSWVIRAHSAGERSGGVAQGRRVVVKVDSV